MSYIIFLMSKIGHFMTKIWSFYDQKCFRALEKNLLVKHVSFVADFERAFFFVWEKIKRASKSNS